MAKRVNMTEKQALALLAGIQGVSIKERLILIDRKVFTGFNSLRKSAAYDCLRHYHGYK